MTPFFADKEIKGLQPRLVKKMVIVRAITDLPMIVNSGFRTAAQNARVGGVENSAHLTGEAVDVSCKTSNQRMRLLIALEKAGITRVGIYSDHLHFDVSETLPLVECWLSLNVTLSLGGLNVPKNKGTVYRLVAAGLQIQRGC